MAENISVTLVLDDSQYTGKIDRAGKAVEDFGNKARVASDKAKSGFDRLAASSESIKQRLDLLGGAILGAGFLEATRRALASADAITDLAGATGVTVPELVNLKKAFELAGGSGEQLGRALTGLSSTLNAAQEGSAKAQEALLGLGFTFRDITNLGTDEAFKKAGEALSQMGPSAERTALALQIFGKAGAQIDWEEFSAKVKAGGSEYDRYAESIIEAGKAHDKLAQASGNLQLAFTRLLDESGILNGINSITKNMAVFERAVTAAGIAFGVYFGTKTLIVLIEFAGALDKIVKGMFAVAGASAVLENSTVIGRLAKLALLVAGAGAAYLGWDKMQDQFAENDKRREAEAAARERAKFAANDPRRVDQKKTENAPAQAAWAKEIAAIDAISDAYKRNNSEALNKIELQTKLIGQSEDQKQLQEALATATAEYNKQQASLNDKIKQTQENAQIGKNERGATITALKKEQEQVTALYTEYSVRVGRAIKEQQDLNALQRFRSTQYENQISLENRLKKIQDESNKAGLSDRERRYYDIAAAARESAKAEADAEEKRLGFDADGKKIKLTAEARQKFLEAAQERAIIETEAAQRADDQATQFSTGWNRAYKQFAEDSANAASFAQKQFDTMTKGLEDAFITFAKTGKLSFKSLINDMVEQMLRNDFRKLMGGLLSGGAGGSGGGLLSGIGKLFGLAGGGSVSMNKPVLVGEQGPEIFMPSGNGSIIPNSQIGAGASQSVNYYISAVDARSFQALIARDPKFIHAVAEQGRMSMPTSRR
jgi:hypothetical protein